MSDNPTPQPPPPTTPIPLPTAVPQHKRSRQDSQIQDDMTKWERQIKTILETNDYLAALETKGKGRLYLTQLSNQNTQLLAAYINRDKALTHQEQMAAEQKNLFQQAKQTHVDYRSILRLHITDHALQEQLRLIGRTTTDLQKFITELRTAYTTHLNTPAILAITTPIGYDTATLQAMLTALDTLNQQNGRYEQAVALAIAATQTRDQQHLALRTEIKKLKAIAKVITRNQPQWAHILN